MKKILVLLLSLIFWSAYGQRYSFSTVERISAEGITYELDKTPMSYKYDNVENYRTNGPFINLDGTLATGTWEDYDEGNVDEEAIRQVMRGAFTPPQELLAFKNTNTRVGLYFVFDNEGRMLEISFHFNATEPVKSLPVERIAQLEKRLKEKVTTNITDPATKKLQFIGTGYSYNFKYMDGK